MTDFNDIKGAVLNTLGTVAEKTKSIAGKAADKAKDVTKLAKLNLELNSEKDTIQKAYTEIGKLYYETHRNAPDSFFVQLCDEITLASENAARLQVEIEEIKAGIDPRADKADSIEVEFEEVSPEETAETASDDDFVKESSCEASGATETPAPPETSAE